MKKRYTELDLMRTIGIIWIVCFWHLCDYTRLSFRSYFALYFTESIMACFFFLSGLMLNGHKQMNSRTDKVNYAVKRIVGFFIPLAISVITLIPLNWFDSSKQALLTVVGLGAFSPPMAGTLWFSSVLLLYYVFGFFFFTIRNNKKKQIISIGLIALSLVFIVLFSNSLQIDGRLIIYFPIYIISLNINLDKLMKMHKKHLLLIITICIMVISIVCIWRIDSIKKTAGYISFVFLMLILSIQLTSTHLLKNKTIFSSVIEKIGITSSFAYFFHRQYFIVIRAIIKRIFGVAEVNIWLAYLLVLPFFFFACYILSVLYNRFSRTIMKKLKVT